MITIRTGNEEIGLVQFGGCRVGRRREDQGAEKEETGNPPSPNCSSRGNEAVTAKERALNAGRATPRRDLAIRHQPRYLGCYNSGWLHVTVPLVWPAVRQ